MKRKLLSTGLVVVAVLGLLGAAGYGLYMTGMNRGIGMSAAPASTATSAPAAGGTSATAAAPNESLPQSIAQGEEATRRHITAGIKAGEVDPATGKKILYYHDPMVPGNKFDKPAKSPFMDMMLVPVYADAGNTDNSSVAVSPRVSGVPLRARWAPPTMARTSAVSRACRAAVPTRARQAKARRLMSSVTATVAA